MCGRQPVSPRAGPYRPTENRLLRRWPAATPLFDPIAEAVRNWRGAGWGDAAPGVALVTSIMRTHQIRLSRVDATLTPFGLTFSRFEVLMLLDFSRTGRLPLGRIGARLQVHPASVTNAIDRLEPPAWSSGSPTPPTGAPPSPRSPRRAAGSCTRPSRR